MKKLIIVALIIALMMLSSCATSNKSDERGKRMKVVESGGFHAVYVDTETGVAYLKGYNGGMCVMVDKDGKPLIWK